MSKYDFGYKIEKGSTNEWVLNCISAGSKVLEFGPSIGYLTKALKEKSCYVDIVEINQEAGEKASEFAQFSLIGEEKGNIENYFWLKHCQNNFYDAIVFLDILEHLHNPNLVLSRAKDKLKKEGHIYISVPNIAHNSIILNLINDRFEYTNLGLLDDTHIHFFSYYSLKKMCEEAGFEIVTQGAIQKAVGDNEVSSNYSDVSCSLERELRMRMYPDAYQFLFQLAMDNKNLSLNSPENLDLIPLDQTNYSLEIYIRESDESSFLPQKVIRKYYRPGSIELELNLYSYPSAKEIMITFSQKNCIIRSVKLFDEDKLLVNPSMHNGIELKNGEILFSGVVPQCRFTLPNFSVNYILLCNISFFDDPLIDKLKETIVPLSEHIVLLDQKLQESERDVTLLKTYLNETRDKEGLLNEVLIKERDKSKTLTQLLEESRMKESKLDTVLQAEREKSDTLMQLLEESRSKEAKLDEVLQTERRNASSLMNYLEESRKKETDLRGLLSDVSATNETLSKQLERNLYEYKEFQEKTNTERDKLEKEINFLKDNCDALSEILNNLYASKGWSFVKHLKLNKFFNTEGG